jgi:hypothetical protein
MSFGEGFLNSGRRKHGTRNPIERLKEILWVESGGNDFSFRVKNVRFRLNGRSYDFCNFTRIKDDEWVIIGQPEIEFFVENFDIVMYEGLKQARRANESEKIRKEKLAKDVGRLNEKLDDWEKEW